MFRLLSFVVAIVSIIAGLISPSLAACQTDDIEIRQADWHRVRNSINIVGEFFNRCTEPTGVQLAFTFRDSAGKVVGVKEGWPASTRNIEPNTTYPFEWTVDAYLSASSMTARVLEVHRWGDQK